jgi:hypothetical protein
VALPDIITYLLNLKMIGELKRTQAKELSNFADADPRLALFVI